jgi:transcriptional regulator with XRE-family HTH domain
MVVEGSNEVPTGEALEKARRRVGFSVEGAAASLGVTTAALADFESGVRTPSEELISAMSKLYGVEKGRFASRPWVPRVPPRFDEETGVLWLGWCSIKVVPGDNDHLARSVAAAIRTMRSLTDDSPVRLRSSDLQLLGRLFDLDDELLPDRLASYLRLPPNEALGIVNTMVASTAVLG